MPKNNTDGIPHLIKRLYLNGLIFNWIKGCVLAMITNCGHSGGCDFSTRGFTEMNGVALRGNAPIFIQRTLCWNLCSSLAQNLKMNH